MNSALYHCTSGIILQHTFVLIVYKLDENCLKLEVARISSSRRSDTKLDAMHMINVYKRIQLPLSTQFIAFTFFQTNDLPLTGWKVTVMVVMEHYYFLIFTLQRTSTFNSLGLCMIIFIMINVDDVEAQRNTSFTLDLLSDIFKQMLEMEKKTNFVHLCQRQ
uniref:Uncharacterized protein n=1 Tax=Glossina austeni TaxID=7395 RepID=A0A1A9UN03_GLOAU